MENEEITMIAGDGRLGYPAGGMSLIRACSPDPTVTGFHQVHMMRFMSALLHLKFHKS